MVKNITTKLLEYLAQATWERLDNARRYQVSQGEETITDINLLDLKRYGGQLIRLRKCPKHLESKRGIDWDWVIGSNKLGWRRYAVQAKKLTITSPSSTRYKTLAKKVSIKQSGQLVKHKMQLDILRRFAKQTRATPIYCLYNYAGKPSYSKYWQCCSESCDAKQLGCTITPASVIDWAINNHGKRSFRAIHGKRATIPWRCLAFCPYIFHKKHRDMASDQQPESDEPPGFLGAFRGDKNVSNEVPRDFASLLRSDNSIELFEEAYANSEAYPKWVVFIDLSKDADFDDSSLRLI